MKNTTKSSIRERLWRRVDRLLHPVRVGPLLAKIDQNRLRAILSSHASTDRHWSKHLDVRGQLIVNIHRVQDVGLHRLRPPLDVLDLGSGSGYFLFVAKEVGHHSLGFDTGKNPLYNDITELLGVPRKIGAIHAFESLPDLGRQFDWITTFSPVFQGTEQVSQHWGRDEWEFLIDDLNRHLKPGGRIFFSLNPSYNGDYYTAEILDLFLSRGAEVEGPNVRFPPKHGS